MKRDLTSSQKKRFQFLLMKAVDNEMSGDEPREFEPFLYVYDECKPEGQRVKKLKAVIQGMKFRAPPDQVWDIFWTNVRQCL